MTWIFVSPQHWICPTCDRYIPAGNRYVNEVTAVAVCPTCRSTLTAKEPMRMGTQKPPAPPHEEDGTG